MLTNRNGSSMLDEFGRYVTEPAHELFGLGAVAAPQCPAGYIAVQKAGARACVPDPAYHAEAVPQSLDPMPTATLKAGSVIFIESGSVIRRIGMESPDRYVIFDMPVTLIVDRIVYPLGGESVRLQSSVMATLPGATDVEIPGSGGQIETFPAKTTVTVFGLEPEGDGGLVTVSRAAPGSTWLNIPPTVIVTPVEPLIPDVTITPVEPSPCGEGYEIDSKGECAPVATTPPVTTVVEESWYTKPKYLAIAGVVVLAGLWLLFSKK